MKFRLYPLLILLVCATPAWTQKKQYSGLCDTLNTYLKVYKTGNYRPHFAMKVDSAALSEDSTTLTLYANEAICGQAFTEASLGDFTRNVEKQIPETYQKYKILWKDKYKRDLSEYIPNYARTMALDSTRMLPSKRYDGAPWVKRIGPQNAILKGGVNGRHLMVNASHGRYFDTKKWLWQRPYLFCTTEDLLTRSFVYPYLVPMLERSGAVVPTACERDIQTEMRVVDNDKAHSSQHHGKYKERSTGEHKWHTCATGAKGFAMPYLPMNGKSNPFEAGTYRQITATKQGDEASATWAPKFKAGGEYAVYVSYATLPQSISDAHYIVKHKGQETHFLVNQKMGGGTWVYLGTFDFGKDCPEDNCVVLTNKSQEEGIVTADAVRWGGGMAMHNRNGFGTSGMPRYLEAATYNALWSGVPYDLFNMKKKHTDYSDDIRARGAMANHLAGGSTYLPDSAGLRVPLDAVVAVHSDAGAKDAKTIIGTLGIATTVKPGGIVNFPSGMSRKTSLDLTTSVVTSISQNLSKQWQTAWTQREVWDRNYGECRTPHVPSMILEMFSHQNYTDFTLVHDPMFKASMARAIYAGIQRYVSTQYGETDYSIHPLSIRRFAVRLSDDQRTACLSWQPTIDTLYHNATPTGYIVYTRIDDGDFDNGVYVAERTTYELPIEAGKRYDFKVNAINAGGESADSEILSVYAAEGAKKKILLVNGFYRLSGPARVETSTEFGFDLDQDFGVPDKYTAAFAGRQLCFDRSKFGREKEGALGFCGNELEGKIIGGNTFDYPTRHGSAIAALNVYSYESASREAWLGGDMDLSQIAAIDYIAGAECDAPQNLSPFKTFDAETRRALTSYLNDGGALLVSGCYLGSDAKTTEEKAFLRETLKCEFAGTARCDSTEMVSGLGLEIPVHRGIISECYPIQSPDILTPTDSLAFPAFAYYGGGSAGVAYAGADYRLVAMGFPFESIKDKKIQIQAIEAILRFLTESEE